MGLTIIEGDRILSSDQGYLHKIGTAVSHQSLLTIRHEKRDFGSFCNSSNIKKRMSLLRLGILFKKQKRGLK
uniref:Uncharacterized protein n=1 Tax=Rhizophagus irregularis (strain DAOM 181602 / DAOM 197198 / MUCL 43194) TaxID=747089 RepID=U9U1H2_RHIID